MNYVYTAPSLSKELCETIIHQYESNPQFKYSGVTAGGVDKRVKDTHDMIIPENEEWNNINKLLSDEIQKHIKLYLGTIETAENYKKDNNYGHEYHHLQEELIQVNNFMIQRYEQNKGKYVYHTDDSNEMKHCRAVTYLWYLNDVVEGGETEFFGGSFRVKPETGKLLLFPACWSFPHRGNMPISSSKYIVTGWLYTKNKTKVAAVPTIATPEVSPCDIQETREHPTEEQKLVFDYFYIQNKHLFIQHKKQTENEIYFTIPTYTGLMTEWLMSELQEVTTRTKPDTMTDILPFVLSSFQILVNDIKSRLQIQCNFNIKDWFILFNEKGPFEFQYDLCIQSELTTGESHVSTKYKELSGYQMVYFVEFTFQYVDKTNEMKTFTLKEIADPCLEFIEPFD
jgi:hypothetical protein